MNNYYRVFAVILCMMGLVLFAGCSKDNVPVEETAFTTETAKDATDEPAASTEPEAETKTTEEDEEVNITITMQDGGVMQLELYPEKAPKTVANFVKLAKEGFYDGLTFHRIIEGFMIQGGDPMGTGMGGSDENIVGEFASNGFPQNDIAHVRGVISMARAMDPNSASSQFFICDADSPHLDKQYASFGWVVEGMDVVDAIAAAAKPSDSNGTIPKDSQPVIESITIEEITETK